MSLELGLVRWCPVGWQEQGWRHRGPGGLGEDLWGGVGQSPLHLWWLLQGDGITPHAKDCTELPVQGLFAGNMDDPGGWQSCCVPAGPPMSPGCASTGQPGT